MRIRGNQKLFMDAARYVLDELPSGERRAFEQRLVEDQAARYRVAEAVRICQVTAEALGELDASGGLDALRELVVQPASKVDGVWRRAVVWGAMAVAAGILIALVAGVGRDRRLPGGNRADVASSDDDHRADNNTSDHGKLLAVAWFNSALLNEPADDDAASDDSANDDAAIDDDEELAFVETDANGPAPEADWLFEAITAPPAEPAALNTAKSQEG